MRLTKLHIKNFKGIKELEINLIDRFTVFIGENGTGKTSILEAVSFLIGMISGDFPGTKSPLDIRGRLFEEFSENDIRLEIFSDHKKKILPLEIMAEAMVDESVVKWGRVHRNEVIDNTWEYEGMVIVSSATDASYSLTIDTDLFFNKIYNNYTENTKLPLFAYYGTGRLWLNGEKTEYKERGYRLDGYDNALNPKISNRVFLSWYKTYEDEILKFKKDDSLLKAFKNAITTCVEEWSDIAYSFYDDDLKGLFTHKTGEQQWMLFGLLSDGYRNLIGMVADIAYRCITLNPQLKEDAITEAEGVVLIDEVGLHLHPKWQRKVVEDLKRAFPKIQFIATTHSPFIVQSLNSSEVYNLDAINDVNPSDLTVEEVALNLMGVPSKFGEENTRQEELSKEYLMKINQLHQEKASADRIAEELDKIEIEISDPAVRAFLQIKRLRLNE